MTKENYILGAVAILLAIALGVFIGLQLFRPEPVKIPEPVYLQGKDSVIVKEFHYYHKDTVKAEVKNDTATGTSFTEKVFEKDTVRIRTDVVYSLSDSLFDIALDIDLIKTKEIRIDTLKIPYETIKEKDIPFYEKPLFTYISGILTILLVLLIGS